MTLELQDKQFPSQYHFGVVASLIALSKLIMIVNNYSTVVMTRNS